LLMVLMIPLQNEESLSFTSPQGGIGNSSRGHKHYHRIAIYPGL